MKRRLVLFSGVLALVLSIDGLACGDSLYRVGKGVSYRTYSAPLPGNLLVFGESDGAQELAEELARSGHGVHVVGSAQELSAELEKGGYDVVIAPFSARDTIEAAGSSSSYLPIAVVGNEEKLAREAYERVMVPEKHEIKHYLKEIHRALKSQG